MSPTFYSQQFYQTIKTAREENCVDKWSSNQWYQYLLGRKYLSTEITDDAGASIWEPIKCSDEIEYELYNWDITWARAYMPGLSNEATFSQLRLIFTESQGILQTRPVYTVIQEQLTVPGLTLSFHALPLNQSWNG